MIRAIPTRKKDFNILEEEEPKKVICSICAEFKSEWGDGICIDCAEKMKKQE